MKNQERSGHDLEHLREMIKDIDFCMLTTVCEDGSLHSRPMANNSEVEFDGELWFFTYRASLKIAEIERSPKVNVSFAKPEAQEYVSLSGTARLVRDRQKMEELWKPALKAWFPKGLEEPDIALLNVRVEKAEYWDSPSSTVAHVVGVVKALATGATYDAGEHQKVDI